MPASRILVFNLSPARKQKRTSLVAHALVKISTQLGFPLPTAEIALLEEIRLYRIARPESLFKRFSFPIVNWRIHRSHLLSPNFVTDSQVKAEAPRKRQYVNF